MSAKIFKSGNGHQSANKKAAAKVGEVLVMTGKIPTYDNGLPVGFFVTTHEKSNFMVLPANNDGKPQEDDQQGILFTYDGDRLLAVGFPSMRALQEIAIKNNRCAVLWSELLSASERGHFTVV